MHRDKGERWCFRSSCFFGGAGGSSENLHKQKFNKVKNCNKKPEQ